MHGYAELIEGWRDKCREAESERDALRAEVEVLRRALKEVVGLISMMNPGDDCPRYDVKALDCIADCVKCLSAWAISEARKGE
jgi:hypothetical protein